MAQRNTVAVVVFVLLIGAILWYEYNQSATVYGAAPCCNPCCGPSCVCAGCGITNEECTWPSGDNIWNICQACAIAEGANVQGSAPDANNNPGDISDGYATYGGMQTDGSNVTTFPDKKTGWQWLYNKWSNIVNGKSTVYPVTDTWAQIAVKWAGNSQAWLNNVTSVLGVDPSSTPAQYVNCS